jgi:hypothetical protein
MVLVYAKKPYAKLILMIDKNKTDKIYLKKKALMSKRL